LPARTEKRRQSKWFGWWYISIGCGFFLLGLRSLFGNAGALAVALRWLIAAGFLALGSGTLRFARHAEPSGPRRPRDE
jgi:hypothetical protein